MKILFSYFSTKTYDAGTQKNRLNETGFMSIQNMIKSNDKKIFTILFFMSFGQISEKIKYLPNLLSYIPGNLALQQHTISF